MAGGPQPSGGHNPGGTTAGGNDKHGKWHKWKGDTQWALIKIGDGKKWLRVGSPAWNKQHQLAHIQGRKITPLKFTRGQWNPSSPQWRKQHANDGKGNAQHGAPDALRDKQKGDGPPNNVHHDPPKKPNPSQTQRTKQTKGLSAAIGNPNVNKLQSPKGAKAIANLQYDAAIKALKRQLAVAGVQNDDNIKQLKSWYDAAQEQNTTAQTRNATTFGDAAEQQDAAQRFLHQGGQHLEGANDLMDANGAAASAMFRQLGASDSAYHQDMKSVLSADAADSIKREQNRAVTQIGDINNQLTSALAAKGQARVVALQAILQQNNAARQANYGNRTSKIGTIASLLQLGQNLQLGDLNIRKGQAELGANAGGHKKFDTYNPAEQDQLVASWVGRGEMGHANVSHAAAVKKLQAMGFSITNPHIQQFLATYYTPAGNGKWTIIK